MNKHLASLIIIFCLCFNHSYSNRIKLVLNWEKTPSDTLIKLANSNVDSIIDSLSYEINRADSFINTNQAMLNYENYLIVHALGYKYNLKYKDSIIYNQTDTLGYITILDTCVGGSLTEASNIFKYIKINNLDLYKLFTENTHFKSTKHSLVCFCDYYNNAQIDKKAFDFLLNHNNLSSLDILENYYLLTAYIKNSCANDDIDYFQNFKEQYFNSQVKPLLFNKENIAIQSDSMTLRLALTLPIKAIAYSLFGNNISIFNIGNQYLFLINSINKKVGGFNNTFVLDENINTTSEIEPTIYGLWSLLQIREQLIDYKKELQKKENNQEGKKKK